MTPENQALLAAIREMIIEANAPIVARLEGLERQVETIDARTSEILSDFQDLRDRVPLLEERIDNGFRALKSDLTFAFSAGNETPDGPEYTPRSGHRGRRR
jgi:hypothetical protein